MVSNPSQISLLHDIGEASGILSLHSKKSFRHCGLGVLDRDRKQITYSPTNSYFGRTQFSNFTLVTTPGASEILSAIAYKASAGKAPAAGVP